jgi:GTP cyclohydrolase I
MNGPDLSYMQASIRALLAEVGEDPTRNGLLETPKRFEKQMRECLVGYNDDPKKYVKLFESTDFHDLVVVSKINFSSLCEHHVLPFYGYVDVAYVPSDKILGLSKFARIIDAFSKRLQVQERLTKELADFLYENLEPELLMVRIYATHSCMTVRGVRRPESQTETISVVGDTEANRRHVEYFQNMYRRNG